MFTKVTVRRDTVNRVTYVLTEGYLIVIMMGVYSSVALKIYPSLQHYNGTTEFTSFICSNDDDSYVSGGEVAWLYPNFTIMTSTPDFRIDVYDDFVTFTPPLFSDAGSYWCRNVTNHSDIAEGKLLFKDATIEQNNAILWALFYPYNMLISETLKYTIIETELIIHNTTIEDEGEYACYSKETAKVYTVIRSPELITDQSQTVTVNVGEEVILNCTTSASPDPVYRWLFPNSCSSCPNTSNDSVLIFTAKDTIDSGEYTCIAENLHGNLSVKFGVNIMTLLVDCGAPKMPINGIVKFDATVKGSIVNYECNEGCILSGVVQRVCNDNGQWSGNAPQCKILAPDIITHPTNASAATPFGALFTCSIKGCGKLNIVWHRYTKPLPRRAYATTTVSLNETMSTLTIPDVTIEDVGTYYCVAWAGNKATQSKVAHLFLAAPPLQPVVEVSSVVNLTVDNFNLTMKCIPDNNHLPYTYTWLKKGGVLPSRAKGVNSAYMTISSLKPNDSGDYQCIVSNRTGRIKSKFSTVKITVSLPKITKQPNDVNVTTTCNSASFMCTAYGFGLINIVWERINYTLPITFDVTEQKNLNTLSSTLTISEIVGYYSGQYYCVVKNRAGIITSQIANLHVKKICKPEMILPSGNIALFPFQDCKLNCLALSSGVLAYDWIKWNGDLPQTAKKSYIHGTFFNSLGSETTVVYNLAITSVQPSDEGMYCCVATNEGGNTTRCTWLEVNTLPNVTIQPASVKFKVGNENVTAMYCKVRTAVKTPIYYQWEQYDTLRNSWTRPSQRAVNITSPQLEFSIITEEDEGVYHCIASNEDGSVVSDNSTIVVYGPPKIILISNHMVSMEGDEVNLSCIINSDAHANYSLQISWYKEDKLVIPNGKRILLHNEGSAQLTSTLMFDPVNPSDDGVYTCRASYHPDLYTELKTNLTVEYAPHVSIISKSPYLINAGSLGVLFCQASGKPTPTVQWYKNDIPINHIASYFQQALLILNNTKHTTVYTCIGKNYAGNKKHVEFANITVIVRDLKPCHTLLEAPENGERSVIEIDGFAKHISFSCNSLYALKGRSLATCNNGTWSSSTPTCKL